MAGGQALIARQKVIVAAGNASMQTGEGTQGSAWGGRLCPPAGSPFWGSPVKLQHPAGVAGVETPTSVEPAAAQVDLGAEDVVPAPAHEGGPSLMNRLLSASPVRLPSPSDSAAMVGATYGAMVDRLPTIGLALRRRHGREAPPLPVRVPLRLVPPRQGEEEAVVLATTLTTVQELLEECAAAAGVPVSLARLCVEGTRTDTRVSRQHGLGLAACPGTSALGACVWQHVWLGCLCHPPWLCAPPPAASPEPACFAAWPADERPARSSSSTSLVGLIRSTASQLGSRERLVENIKDWVSFFFVPEGVSRELRGQGLISWLHANVWRRLREAERPPPPGTVAVAVAPARDATQQQQHCRLHQQQQHVIIVPDEMNIQQLRLLVQQRADIPPQCQLLFAEKLEPPSWLSELIWALARLAVGLGLTWLELLGRVLGIVDPTAAAKVRLQLTTESGRELAVSVRQDTTLRQLAEHVQTEHGETLDLRQAIQLSPSKRSPNKRTASS